MTLQPIAGPGTSQRYQPPATYNTSGDVTLARGGNPALPSVRPMGAPRIFGPHAVDAKRYPGLYWVKLEWNDSRGGNIQYGNAEETMNARSIGDLVCDGPGILRHAFLTGSQATPDPTGLPNRMVHANAFGQMYTALTETVSGGSVDKIFTETSATDSTIMTVAGFVPPGGARVITSLRTVQVNGVQYLAVCYFTNGGVGTLEFLSNAALTATTVLLFVPPTHDIIQVPVYSDALLALNGNGVYRAGAANVAVGSLAFTQVETVPQGGYWVGIMGAGVGVGTPSVAGVFPKDGAALMAPGIPTQQTGSTKRGKILLFQLSGLLLGELPVKTPWVTNATRFADGLFYCDTETHYYWNGREHLPVRYAGDLLVNSDFKRVCAGHHVKGDKIYWCENYTVAAGGAGNTQQFWWEYDLYTNTCQVVSFGQNLATTGPQTIGGPNMAVSEQSGRLHCYAANPGKWYQQYQPPSSIRGIDKRKTEGSTASTGEQFEPTGYWLSTNTEITGFEDARHVVASVTGPLTSELAKGGTADGGDQAYMQVTVTGQPQFTWTQESVNRRLHKEFPLGRNSAFSGPVQLRIDSQQQSGGTDPTRKTANVFPMAVEMFMYRKGVDPPTDYEQWDWKG